MVILGKTVGGGGGGFPPLYPNLNACFEDFDIYEHCNTM